jgi:tricorn protease-like protein
VLGANYNFTTRFRRYPRSRDVKGLLPEYDLSVAKFMNVPNKTVKIRILSDGEKIRFYRDGELVFAFTDPAPYREGWFGFRTVRNHMKISNFRVYRYVTS